MTRHFSGTFVPTTPKELDLKNLIRKGYPLAKEESIDYLNQLVNKYNLKWVPNISNEGAWFITAQVCRSIGKTEGDFINKWQQNKTKLQMQYVADEGSLPQILKIEGKELLNLRDSWEYHHNKSLNIDKAIWVMSWTSCLWYLELNKNNNSNIKATSLTNLKGSACLGREGDKYLYGDTEEELLRKRIIEVASYQSKIKLTQEVTVDNILKKEENNKAKTRRFDIVEHSTYKGNRYKIAYELKACKITVDHVKDALGEKGYLELLRYRFPGRRCKLVFLSAQGIEPAAARLIKHNPYVGYADVKTLVDRLIASVLNENKKVIQNGGKQNLWYFFKEFEKLFPKNVTSVSLNASLEPTKNFVVSTKSIKDELEPFNTLPVRELTKEFTVLKRVK